MNQLLSILGKDVKKAGKNWIARCPVHGDKDFAMTIKEQPGGSLTIQCHACGANGLDLYKHLDLDLDELFGKPLEREVNYASPQIRSDYILEQFVVIIYNGDVRQGKTISIQDQKRVKLAKAKIEGMRNKYNL